MRTNFLLYPVGSPAYPQGACVPWTPSQTDMLAEDWQIVGQEQPSAPTKKVYTANDIKTIEAHTLNAQIVAVMRDGAKVTVSIEQLHFRSGVLTWDEQIQLVLDKINAQQ